MASSFCVAGEGLRRDRYGGIWRELVSEGRGGGEKRRGKEDGGGEDLRRWPWWGERGGEPEGRREEDLLMINAVNLFPEENSVDLFFNNQPG
jgi:hypothetical protein